FQTVDIDLAKGLPERRCRSRPFRGDERCALRVASLHLTILGKKPVREAYMRLRRDMYLALAYACLVLVPTANSQHQHSAGELGRFGSVSFPVSCDASVQERFNRAVAILHSFGYEKAAGAFTEVAE